MSNVYTILRRYGFIGSLRLAIDLIYTRTLFRGARLVRRPTYIRGRSYIYWASGFTTGVNLRIDAFPETEGKVVSIGKNVQINDFVHIAAIKGVRIGDNTLIASRVFISDHQHGDYRSKITVSTPDTNPVDRALTAQCVDIGERVWIGEQVCILPGVRIGDGAIIGAGSTVTSNIPANTIVAGNPAKPIRRYNSHTQTWERASAKPTDPDS